MPYGYIYRITNDDNQKAYIGSTTQDDPRIRWHQHKYDAKNRAYRMPIHRAMNKYGEDKFKFEVIAKCPSREMMNTMERAFISLFKTRCNDGGYNVQNGGELSGKHSEETKRKNSKIWYERAYEDHVQPVDMYDLEGNLIAQYESVLEAKKSIGAGSQISQACMGNGLTVKGYVFRYKGEPFDKYPLKGQTTPKPVLQIDKDTGEVVGEYESIREAMRDVGAKSNIGISNVCKGKKGYKTAYGYKWKFKQEVTLT